jgi:hypothetical protein
MTLRTRALLGCILLLSCRSAAEWGSGATEKVDGMTELDEAWLVRPYRAHDMTGYDRIVADSFRIRHSNGRLLTKDEKRADILSTNPGTLDTAFRLKEAHTRYFGQTAVSTGTISEKLSDVYYTNTYVTRDGQWSVVSSQLTRVRRE